MYYKIVSLVGNVEKDLNDIKTSILKKSRKLQPYSLINIKVTSKIYSDFVILFIFINILITLQKLFIFFV